jgi:Sugar-transfer associated ATP-grasp
MNDSTRAVEGGAPQGRREGAGRFRIIDLLRADVAMLYAAMNDRSREESLALVLLRRISRWVEQHGDYLTKLHYCPPMRLFWAVKGEAGSPAEIVHRSYTEAVWGERKSRWARLALGAALLFVWPVVNLGMIGWATWLNGAQIRARTGKGVTRQFAEQWMLAFTHSIIPPYYYVFDLHDPAKRRQAGEYLQRFETKGGLYRLLKRRLRTKSAMQDKVAFAELCQAQGVATAPVILELAQGKPVGGKPAGSQDAVTLPPIDLFVKPSEGRGGQGAERWDRDGAGADGRGGWTREGQCLDEAGLLRHFATLSQAERYLVQPRLVNHPDVSDLSNGALSTIRLLTCMNESGGHEATNAVFRMAVGDNSLVDNFHAGGIAAAVDMATGTLGPATDIGMRADCGWRDRHPNSGAVITGRLLPHWPETLAMACRAHAAFPDRIMIGWDIAVLPEGPQIIEANGSPDLDIHQRCEGRPIGNARFGQLLAFHAQRPIEKKSAAPRPPGKPAARKP